MSPITLDMAETGFYCFPYHSRCNVLKVGHHGEGHPVEHGMSSEDLRSLEMRVRAHEEKKFIAFLDDIVPNFSSDWVVKEFRLCQYCDSRDSHFLVDRVRPNVICAAGGSGHGFKFGVVVGDLIADLVEGIQNSDPVMNEAAKRFTWRSTDLSSVSYEKSRNYVKMEEVTSRL